VLVDPAISNVNWDAEPTDEITGSAGWLVRVIAMCLTAIEGEPAHRYDRAPVRLATSVKQITRSKIPSSASS
jgi:hypothetical protein